MEIDNQVASRALSTQLMEAFPILVVSFKDSCVLINCNELLVSSDGFEKLLLLDQKPKKGATAARQSATATTSVNLLRQNWPLRAVLLLVDHHWFQNSLKLYLLLLPSSKLMASVLMNVEKQWERLG